MYIPSARDVVEIAGLPDVFQVLWVNQPGRRVDLLAVRKKPYAIADVPFSRVRPYLDDPELENPDREMN